MNKEIKNRQLSLWGKSKLKKHPSGNIYGEKESEMFIGAAFCGDLPKIFPEADPLAQIPETAANL